MAPTLQLSTTELVAVVFALVLVFALHQRKASNLVKRLPPGPRKIPIFGNLFQAPVLRPYPKFRSWAQKYGPIYHLRIGPQDMIVLNTAEAAEELLANRSKTYSSRSAPHVAHDIMSAGQRMVFLPYDKEWKTARRTLHSSIGPGPSKKLRPVQELESRVLLYDLMTHGDKSVVEEQVEGPNGEVPELHWFSLIRRYTTSIVMNVMYGKRIHKIADNPHLHKICNVLANFSSVAQPGNYLADVFPILRKLPDFLAPWRVKGREMHEWEMELWGGLLDELRTEMRNGHTREDCYVGSYLKQRADAGKEDAPGSGLTEDGWIRDKLLAYNAGSILEAGSDTTAAVMQTFILFMLSHPQVLQKARDEVERVVGPDRMPTFEDESNMPYLVACIKETLRRCPPVIMGIPHSNSEDDVYNGYLIPKGSTIIGNVWAIHMDPARYPNPTAFTPERFLDNEKPMRWGSGPDQDRDHYVFGWGRRFCQGTYIAEASLFIVLSRILWGIDFAAPTDPTTGIPIIPDITDEESTFTDGLVSTPRIFKASFKPRSERHETIIRRAFESAQQEWQELGLMTDER